MRFTLGLPLIQQRSSSLIMPTPNMLHALLITPLGLLLGGCVASTSEIEATESYRGPLIAAITPMGGQVDQLTGWVARHELEQALAKQLRISQTFSAVEELSSASAPNEAEVIIEPTFLQQGGPSMTQSGSAARQRTQPARDELAVHLRVRIKTSGAIAIDRDYRVPCAQCAIGAVEPEAVRALAKAISSDLDRKFARPPL